MQALLEGATAPRARAQVSGCWGLALKDGKKMPVAKNNLKRRVKGFSLPCDSSAQPQMRAGTLTGAGGPH